MGDAGSRPLQVLVHGFSLTHTYWDLPYGDGRYCYVDAAVEDGYATFNIDRIGVGGSSRPPAAAVTFEANVLTLHDIVSAARNGSITGAPVDKVLLVGHSVGAAMSVAEAGRYRDVDGVIATSFMRTPGPGLAELIGSVRPAQLDPVFEGAGYPLGYVTTAPGTRQQFYATENSDPAVVAADEQTKGTGTLGELATVVDGLSPLGDSQRVVAPVLLAVGDRDRYFCVPSLICSSPEVVLTRERPFFSRTEDLSAYVLPGAGHNAALHLNSASLTQAMLEWSRRVAPPGA